MGNEPSKKSASRYRPGEGPSKSTDGMNPVEAMASTMMNLCTPVTSNAQLTDSVELNYAPPPRPSSQTTTTLPPPGKQKTGRSSYHNAVVPPRKGQNNRTTATGPEQAADRSIKTSIKNVQKDVSMKTSAEQRKRGVPVGGLADSVQTFAASQSTTPFRNRGNDYVMITDALSDVRVK